MGPILGRQNAVEGGRRAAALQVAENRRSVFRGGADAGFRCDESDRYRPAGPGLHRPVRHTSPWSGSSAPSATTTSVNRRPLCFAGEDLVADLLVGPRNFGDQDHVAAAGDPRVQRDPAGVTSHHFQHHHAFVAGGGGVKTIEGVGGTGHGAVESEREGGRREVVVDCLGDADDRNAVFVKLLCDRQRAVAADADKPFDVELSDRRGDTLEQFGIELDAILDANRGGKTPLVGRPQNGSPMVEDPFVFFLVSVMYCTGS